MSEIFSWSLHMDYPLFYRAWFLHFDNEYWDCILIFCCQKQCHSAHPFAYTFTCICICLYMVYNFYKIDVDHWLLQKDLVHNHVLHLIVLSLLSPAIWNGSVVFPLFSWHLHFWNYRRPVNWISCYHIFISYFILFWENIKRFGRWQ